MSDLPQKLDRLISTMRQYNSLLIAYSGGVDSSVVMAVSHGQAANRTLACIASSPSYPSAELREAVRLAAGIGCPCRVIATHEHTDAKYLANSCDRCFHCKTHLFSRLQEIARAEGFHAIADGVHADDLHDHSGGIRAARQFGVRSPLLEAGLGKSDVRAIARHLGLPVADKPAAPCLASRVPQGTPITLDILARIDRAECCLRDLGFSDFRVRHHGDIARIELPEAQFIALLDHRDSIADAIRAAGYAHVTLDLKPRQSQSAPTIANPRGREANVESQSNSSPMPAGG